MENKILLIEDDEEIRNMIKDYLTGEFEVCPFQNGKSAIESGGDYSEYLLALIDLMLPDISGMEVIKAIRRVSTIPIIIITAKDNDTDKSLGLNLSADDYVVKPFSLIELTARIKANIRRVSMAPAQPPQPGSEPGKRLDLGRVVVDLEGATVYKDGRALELTQREYDLIRFLASQPGKVFSREALMEHVWNYEGYVGDVRAVDVAVRRLREKVEDDPASPQFVVTRRGLGYYFNA